MGKANCSKGQACGYACISKAFACLDSLSAEAQAVATGLVALAKSTSHRGSLYSYTDAAGKTWFVKRYASIEADAVEAETKAYETAQRLGIAGMLLRPKFIAMADGKVLAMWPMLEGHTLREHKQPLTLAQQLALAVARQFDHAIANADRNEGNVWILPNGSIRLLDHDNAFSKSYAESSAHASNMTLNEAKQLWRL